MKRSGNSRLAAVAALSIAAAAAAPAASAQLLGSNLAPNVNIINPPGAPVPVHEVADSARQPVAFSINVGMSWGTQYGCAAYTVPSNKRLEIDHVSASSGVLYQGNTIQASYAAHLGSDVDSYFLDLHDQGFNPAQPLYVADQSQLAFADPGTQVQLCATLKTVQGSGSGGFNALRATFSGYLINVP